MIDTTGTFQNDPYGHTIQALLALITVGLKHEGSMSEGEHANLIAIEEFIRTRDNA